MTTAVQSRRLVRKREALTILGNSNTQLYEDIKAGRMVAPVKVGGRVVAFPSDELDAIVSARVGGLATDEMRALVDRLHAQRKTALSALLGTMQ